MQYIRYMGQAGRGRWPVPFAFSAPGDLQVSLIDPETGLETVKSEGVDYLIVGNEVQIEAPDGVWLQIRARNGAASTRASGVAPSGLQVQAASDASAAAIASLSDKLDALLERQDKPVLVASPQMASASALSLAEEPAASETARVQALESRLAALESDRESALLMARQAEEDLQVQRVAQSGEEAQAAVAEACDTAKARAVAEISAAASDAANDAQAAAAKAQEDARAASQAARQALEAAQAALDDLAKTRAELEALKAAQARELEQSAKSAANTLNARASRAVGEVNEAAAAAITRARGHCDLPGHIWPAAASMELESEIEAGSFISLPLAYYPGRNSLLVAHNGALLVKGRDYEEVGPTDQTSDRLKLLTAAHVGAILAFWVAPTNPGRQAHRYAHDARDSATLAVNHAQAASRYRESAREYCETAQTSATRAQAFAACSDASRARAHSSATAAWQAAWQASMASMRPGIASIKDPADLARVNSGLYVVNSCLIIYLPDIIR